MIFHREWPGTADADGHPPVEFSTKMDIIAHLQDVCDAVNATRPVHIMNEFGQLRFNPETVTIEPYSGDHFGLKTVRNLHIVHDGDVTFGWIVASAEELGHGC